MYAAGEMPSIPAAGGNITKCGALEPGGLHCFMAISIATC